MTSYRPSSRSRGGEPPIPMGPLRALQRVTLVGSCEPFQIVPIEHSFGTAMEPDERMAAKVRWAERAQYAILTWDVPSSFAPYNAVIRISEHGTEDLQRDYLAHLVFGQDPSQ